MGNVDLAAIAEAVALLVAAADIQFMTARVNTPGPVLTIVSVALPGSTVKEGLI